MQAEDGIRDVVRSRGLGDVYKRQHHRWVLAAELLLGARTVYDNFGHAAEAESLFHRCEAPVEVVDPELAEFLRASMLNPLALLDEWFTVVDICKRLRALSLIHI